METIEKTNRRLESALKLHPYLSIEYHDNFFYTTMEKLHANVLGHYAGGDMAYLANASAALQCVAEGVYAQSASINVECIAKGDGDLLLSKCEIIQMGKKLIRCRCDVFVRKGDDLKLVAIAQINMSPISDQHTIGNKIN